MMKKIKFTLFFVLMFLQTFVSASVFQKKASIITNEGKEQIGYIKFFPYSKTPECINFSTEEFGVYKFYTAKDIKGFFFENEKYISASTQFFENSTDINKLNTDPTPILKDSTIFVEVLLEGENSLYVHKSSEFRYFYNDNGSVKPYIHKFYVKYGSQNKKYLFENTEYKKQLNQNLSCNLDLGHQPKSYYFKKFFSDLYNSCYLQSNLAPTYQGESRKNKLNLSLIVGASGILYQDVNSENYISDFNSQSYFTPGIALAWRSKNKKFSYINELMLLSFGKSSEVYYKRIFNNSEYYSFWDVNATYSSIVAWNTYLHFPVQIRSNEFFMNLGLNFTSYAGGKTIEHRYDQFYTQINANSLRTFSSFALDAGYLIGLGYKKNQFGFELRVTPASHLTNYTSVSLNRYSLLCTYDIFNKD